MASIILEELYSQLQYSPNQYKDFLHTQVLRHFQAID